VRILLATPDFPPAHGGIQRLLERLAHHLHGHEVLVLTLDHPDAPAFDRELPYRVARVSTAAGRAAALIALNARLPALATRFGPEAILSGHVICGIGALLARRLAHVPLIQYVYAKELTHREWLPRLVLPRADRVIAVSRYARALALGAGARPDRLSVISPGVDPPPPPRPPSREPLIVTVARLADRYKGFDVMLRAMPLILARHPSARWVLVGDGPLRDEMQRHARRAGFAERVSFTGAISDQERDRWLERAQVFAMPSRVPAEGAGEGFGIVFLEAGRFGVPSVTGNEGGAAEAVLDGLTGIHVDPRDHVALAEAICRLLEDEELRLRYGAAARERAAELSWATMARAVERVLEALSDGR